MAEGKQHFKQNIRTKTTFGTIIIVYAIFITAFIFIGLNELSSLGRQISDQITIEQQICEGIIQHNYGLGNIVELRRTLQTLAETLKFEAAQFENNQH